MFGIHNMLHYLLMLIADRFSEACGNLFTMGSTDGLTPKRPLWIEITAILILIPLVILVGAMGSTLDN